MMVMMMMMMMMMMTMTTTMTTTMAITMTMVTTFDFFFSTLLIALALPTIRGQVCASRAFHCSCLPLSARARASSDQRTAQPPTVSLRLIIPLSLCGSFCKSTGGSP